MIMKTAKLFLVCVFFMAFVSERAPWAVAPGSDYPIAAVPASQVTLTDAFWAPKLETNRQITADGDTYTYER